MSCRFRHPHVSERHTGRSLQILKKGDWDPVGAFFERPPAFSKKRREFELSAVPTEGERIDNCEWFFSPSASFGGTSLPEGGFSGRQKPRGFPPWGKLSAELTDEGDTRPLPFKGYNTVGRAFKERRYKIPITFLRNL